MTCRSRFARRPLALVTLTLVVVAGLATGPTLHAASGEKMAMIFPGSIQDADFNTVGYRALQDVAQSHDLQVAPPESVAGAAREGGLRGDNQPGGGNAPDHG